MTVTDKISNVEQTYRIPSKFKVFLTLSINGVIFKYFHMTPIWAWLVWDSKF